MKSLEDHVKKMVIHIGKYKDLPLVECIDFDWLDWYVKSEYTSKWKKKLVNKYIDDRANKIMVEDNKVQLDYKEYEELKEGVWIDDKFQ